VKRRKGLAFILALSLVLSSFSVAFATDVAEETTPVTETTTEAVAPVATATNTAFADIAGHWAEAYIAEMVGEGIISGYPDGSFKPDGKITRAEFAALIVKGFSLTGSSGKVFNDTKDHWAKDFIAIANAKNIVNGYSETSFGPDDPITREQMAVMVVKAAKLIDKGSKTFADSSSISEWAEEAVAIATGSGIITGYPDNTFKPQGNTSRAEAAVVLGKSLITSAPPVVEPKKPDYSVISKAGTYGPKTGTETVTGNVTVKAEDTILQNLIIKGDLTIAKEVGDGDVTLDNIKVLGKTFIRGGGKDSIHINGGDYNDIIIESTASGAVRIVATNTDGLQVVISANAKGEEIILNGEFKNVTVNAEDVKVITQADTTINELKVPSGLKDINIELAKDSSVKEIVLNSEANVRGQGTIKEASGSKAKDSRYSGSTQPDTITTPAPSGGGGGGSSSSSGSKTVVSAISVVTPPSNIIYTEGDLLDLAGLVVKVEKSNGTEENVAFDNFASKGITTSPANGAVLATSNTKVTITVGGKSVDQTITVNAAPLTIAGYYLDTSDTALVTTANVANGTDQTTALSGLSIAGYAKLSDGTYEAITITWSFVETYDGTVAGAKAVTGIVSPAKVSEIATINQTGTVTVAEKEKVEKPVITPSKTSAANREAGVTFTIGEVSGVTFYYTVNGETPTASSTKYEGSVTLTAPEQDAEATVTIKAIGVKDGAIDSDVAVATVTYWAKDALVPKATISDVTISGMAGEIIEKEVTVTLENDGFEKMYGEWAFGGWLANTTNIVYGTVSGVKTKDIEAGDTEITVTFRFTPQGAINEAIKITIPAHCLQSNKELVAEINNDAKFAIAASNKAELFWPDDSYSGYETIVSINKSDHTLVAIPVTVEAFLVDLKGDNWWSRKMPNLLQTHVVQDSSGTEKGVSATLETGDKLLVTAQDGTGPVTYTITVSEVITAVSVTVTPPAAGQTPNYTVTLPSGAEYKVLVGETSWGDHVPSWWEIPDDDDSERVLLGDDEKFISGKKYLIVIYLVSNEGFYFDKNATVKINDEDPADWYVDVNKYMWIEYIFTATS
jgi:hypothetical protein